MQNCYVIIRQANESGLHVASTVSDQDRLPPCQWHRSTKTAIRQTAESAINYIQHL